MKNLWAIALLLTSQVAIGQNFTLTIDGNPVQNSDTVLKTLSGNGGWFNEVTVIDIQNTSSQDLIINIIQDDTKVISPAFVYIGCGSFGCIPPGVNNPSLNFLVSAGVTTHLTSPAFECSGNQCSGSHIASYNIYDQTGQTNGITFFIKYEIPVTVGLQNSEKSQLLSVHPNPASNQILLISDQPIEGIEIYDVIGNLALKGQACGTDNCMVDISALNEGVYLLKVLQGNATVVQRILVNR